MDRSRLAELLVRDRATFADRHPGSAQAYRQAGSLFGRVPMTWMNMAAGGFPLYLDRASGARVTDVDGLGYADFSLDMGGSAARPTRSSTITCTLIRPTGASCSRRSTTWPCARPPARTTWTGTPRSSAPRWPNSWRADGPATLLTRRVDQTAHGQDGEAAG